MWCIGAWMIFVWLALAGFLWWAGNLSSKIERQFLQRVVRIVLIFVMIILAFAFFFTPLGLSPVGCM